jgi:hypothetical protein
MTARMFQCFGDGYLHEMTEDGILSLAILTKHLRSATLYELREVLGDEHLDSRKCQLFGMLPNFVVS